MFRTGLLIAGFAIVVYLAVLFVSVSTVEASPPVPTVQEVRGGDPARGRVLIGSYGCGSCHLIPGVPGANSLVGPPLSSYAERSYIAGNLPNTPENLTRWVQFPQQVEPGTAMPNLNVTLADARDIAAYLYASSEVTAADLLRRLR